MNSNQEINSDSRSDLNTGGELNAHLEEISLKMDKLIDKIESKKKRDAWDKFQIISSFFSTVLIAGVGIIFTLIYNHREKNRQIAIQKAQLDASKIDAESKQRVTELQALISLTPLLASSDSGVKKKAGIILQALHENFSTTNINNNGSLLSSYIALVNKPDIPIEERINANKQIAAIALSPSSTKSEKKEAITSIVKTATSGDVPIKLKDAANNSLSDMNEKRLIGLQPEVAELAKKMIELAKEDSINILVVSGYVSPARQDSLYALGRTRPGSIVTNIKGGQSSHNKGLAFDVVPYKNNQVEWDNKEAYKKLGEIGHKLGLTWGGDWKSFKDYPHFELTQK